MVTKHVTIPLKTRMTKTIVGTNSYWMQSWYNWDERRLINQDECHN